MVKSLLFLLLWLTVCEALAVDEPKVLLLNSYHPQYRWTAELTRGVQEALTDTVEAENLFIEFMDERRFVDDAAYSAKLIDLLRYKYQQYEPDIIVTSDDYAYYFMVEHGDYLFPGKSIVFCGVNVFYPKTLKGKNNITGIKEGMEIEGNLELILQLQPETERIIMLGDTTGLGLRMVERAREIEAQWHNDPSKKQVNLEIWDQFSLEELYQRAGKVSSNTTFLMLAIHKDKLGNYFSFDYHLPILSSHSKAPVYGMWGALMIGNGVIGGMMNNPYEHGRNAANIALRILNGIPVDQIAIKEKAEYSPFFDYKQLQRFDIDLSRLPNNSTVVDKPVSLYQQHASLINGVIAFVTFLIVVISILVINIRQRINAQAKLRQFNLQLESIVQQRTKDLNEKNRELEIASKGMQKLAHTDTLTGLPNRRAASSEVVAHIQRYNVNFRPLALAILDIDFFKKINDTFGHQTGDEVLCALGETLKTALRPNDRVYRWGGEEFLIVLPDTNSELAYVTCKRMRESVSQMNVGNVGTITPSIGVANFATGDSFDSIVLRADEALYTAKNNGRNQVVVGQ